MSFTSYNPFFDGFCRKYFCAKLLRYGAQKPVFLSFLTAIWNTIKSQHFFAVPYFTNYPKPQKKSIVPNLSPISYKNELVKKWVSIPNVRLELILRVFPLQFPQITARIEELTNKIEYMWADASHRFFSISRNTATLGVDFLRQNVFYAKIFFTLTLSRQKIWMIK